MLDIKKQGLRIPFLNLTPVISNSTLKESVLELCVKKKQSNKIYLR